MSGEDTIETIPEEELVDEELLQRFLREEQYMIPTEVVERAFKDKAARDNPRCFRCTIS